MCTNGHKTAQAIGKFWRLRNVYVRNNTCPSLPPSPFVQKCTMDFVLGKLHSKTNSVCAPQEQTHIRRLASNACYYVPSGCFWVMVNLIGIFSILEIYKEWFAIAGSHGFRWPSEDLNTGLPNLSGTLYYATLAVSASNPGMISTTSLWNNIQTTGNT